MLVLSRKPHQGVWIGDNVFVTVLRIERGRVKLGIEAPDDIAVDREEVRGPGIETASPHHAPTP
jgi:carbon storage regulator